MKTLIYAIRFLARSKSYTLINLLGLAFSLACCIILMRYIHRELTVDTHCVDRDRTVMAVRDIDGTRFIGQLEHVDIFLDKEIVRKDDILQRCSFINRSKDNLIYNEQNFTCNLFIADSTFFHFFDYPVVAGESRLTAPDDAVLTRRFAERVFGKESPIGKSMTYNNKVVTVRGVIDEPKNKEYFCDGTATLYQITEDWGVSSQQTPNEDGYYSHYRTNLMWLDSQSSVKSHLYPFAIILEPNTANDFYIRFTTDRGISIEGRITKAGFSNVATYSNSDTIPEDGSQFVADDEDLSGRVFFAMSQTELLVTVDRPPYWRYLQIDIYTTSPAQQFNISGIEAKNTEINTEMLDY